MTKSIDKVIKNRSEASQRKIKERYKILMNEVKGFSEIQKSFKEHGWIVENNIDTMNPTVHVSGVGTYKLKSLKSTIRARMISMTALCETNEFAKLYCWLLPDSDLIKMIATVLEVEKELKSLPGFKREIKIL
jgi:hypothetical protein